MKIGSLFAGIGGIDLGFEQAGFEVAWANEIDKYACMTYRANFPETLLIESNIRNVDFSQLEKVDVLTAGFPCQPFSVCGKKQGFSDERGNLFFEIMRAADALQPPIIFLENVANLTEHDNGKTFNIIHNELVSRGYIIRYIVADACDYGVPQHRTRTYIVAFKDEDASKRFKFPEKCTLNKHIADVIDMTKEADKSLYYDENSYEYKKLSAAITDSNQIYRFSDYGIQKSKDGISFTLKANMGTWYNRIPIIKDNFGIRKVSPYECLALMGFPKGFVFGNISEKSKYKQCGNSVTVELIKMIAENIKNNNIKLKQGENCVIN
ncbi:MAG: DNA (cytosine-5-)-methyltransferase [bacterium]|nr:DNA (cytosine-5-)-methyltransferase [bacterium]